MFFFLSLILDVEMINKFGQLEFKHGDTERGKTLYEKLLSSYPKRTDLWSIYIDMLIKYDKEPINAARLVCSIGFSFLFLKKFEMIFQINFRTSSFIKYSAKENEVYH